LVLRIVLLDADPPAWLDWSGGYYSDEGFWTHTARNKVVFGDRVRDGWNDAIMSPLMHVAGVAVFRAVGVSRCSARLIPIALSMIMIAGIGWTTARHLGRRVGILALFGCALTLPLTVYNRLAILETPVMALEFLALASGAAALTASQRSRFVWWAWAAGLFAAAAYITKTTAIVMVVPLAVGMAVSSTPRKQKMAVGVMILFGALSVILPYWLAIAGPNAAQIAVYQAYYSQQQSWSVTGLLINAATQPAFLYLAWCPALLLLALLNLAQWRLRRSGVYESMIMAWFWGQLAMFAAFGYRPLRYYAPVLPPLIIIAALTLDQTRNVEFWQKLKQRKALLLIIFAVGTVPALAVTAIRLTGRGPDMLTENPALPWPHSALCVILAATTLAYLLRQAAQRCAHHLPLMFLATFLLIQTGGQLAWKLAPRYEVRDASRFLASHLNGAVIAGQWAPELCMETTFTPIPMWRGFVNDDNPFERYGITHVLSWEYVLGDELAYQREWFPEEMARAVLITTFTIKNSPVHLFEIKGVKP